MTEQTNIFDQPKARITDPTTSHKAAEDVLRWRAGSQRVKLWGAFVQLGLKGGTDEDAMRLAALSPRSEYATRCSELRKAGLIDVTGEERKGEQGLDRIVSAITVWGRMKWEARNEQTT